MSGGYKDWILDLRFLRSVIARNTRALALGLTLGACAGVTWILLGPKEYRAHAEFIPSAIATQGQASDLIRGLPLGLGGLVGVPGGAFSSPELFSDLLSSTRLITAALTGSLDGAPKTTLHRDFLVHFVRMEQDSALSLARAVRKVRKRLRVSTDRIGGLVKVDFSDHDPDVATSFLVSLLDCANSINTAARQTQAAGMRKFLETRLDESRLGLDAAERALADFRQRNMRYSNAPLLSLEESRLQRRVRFAEAVYTTLLQQYELARIDEVRDTPTLIVIEPPVRPVFPSGPGILGKSLITVLGGLALGMLSVMPKAIRGTSGEPG